MDIQFFPTPEALAKRAWDKFKNRDFVRVLEPSAGEGHLARLRPNHNSDYYNKPPTVDCIEIDVTKHPLLIDMGFDVVGVDFMRFSGVGAIYSHILLNPPFAEGAQHVLKAWEMLFDGEVVAILNAETIRNPFSKERAALVQLIEKFGEVEFIEGAFAGSEVERRTDVEIALVYLKKSSNFNRDIMDGIMDGLKVEGHHGLDAGYEETNELAIPANFIENSVLAFDAAVKAMRKSVFAEARAAKYASRLGRTMEEMDTEMNESAKGDGSLDWVRREIHQRHAKFKNSAWAGILRSTEVLSRLSSSAQTRLESEFETIKKLEFSVSNVYGFLGGLIAKQGDIQIGMLCDTFDRIIGYHGENAVYYKTYKSNLRHKVGMRIRTTRFVLSNHRCNFGGLDWNSEQMLRDFDKAFALLDGRTHPAYGLEEMFRHKIDELKAGARLSSSYFDVRYYPGAGTIHFFARDKKLVDRLNKVVGRQRQWLPPEGARVSDAFWLAFDKAEEFDKEVRAEALKGVRNGWDDPFFQLRRNGDKSDAAEDKVAQAVAATLEKHGIDPDAMLEAPETDVPALPLLAVAA